MNMERTKTIVIVCLIFINSALAALIYADKSENILTAAQSNTILSILQKNQISVYATIPTDYSPMKQLEITPFELETKEALRIFLGVSEDEGTTKTEEFNGHVYKYGAKTLRIDKNSYIFDNPEGTGEITTDTETAYELCDAFIREIKIKGITFKRDKPFINDSVHNIEYRAEYKGALIYSSYIKFTVTDKGITRIRCMFSVPAGFTGESREIYSADEALFQLMFRLKDDYGDLSGENTSSNITITDMDMVYYVDEIISNTGDSQSAAPYYRFYVRLVSTGEKLSEPYLINAYNNTILSY